MLHDLPTVTRVATKLITPGTIKVLPAGSEGGE